MAQDGGILYLNNSGHRWKYSNRSTDKVALCLPDGSVVVRTVLYWEAFGNFAAATVKYNGVRITRLPADIERSALGFPVIYLESQYDPRSVWYQSAV